MLNKIYRTINKYAGEEELPNDIEELCQELDKHYVDEYIAELIADNTFIVVDSKYFVKVATEHFVKFAELIGVSRHLQFHSAWINDLIINEGFTQREMMDIIKDLIIRNDLLTTN